MTLWILPKAIASILLFYLLACKTQELESGWRFYLNSGWRTSFWNVVRDGAMAVGLVAGLILLWSL
jgi:hypothetical protein